MSGHSHWATTKRQKGIKDAAKGKAFGKIVKAISIAAKNGADPNSNPKLRMAIEQARAINMPKENIERAITKGSREDVQLEEITYEGFGPSGVGIIVDVATDNRNRTFSEIKNIFERGGGNISGPGSVSFNFEPKGYLEVQKTNKPQDQELALIDIGAENIEDSPDSFEVYVAPSEIGNIKNRSEELGFVVKAYELVKKPKSFLIVEDREAAKRILTLLENLEDQEDVQKVYANADIPVDLSH